MKRLMQWLLSVVSGEIKPFISNRLHINIRYSNNVQISEELHDFESVLMGDNIPHVFFS